MHLALVIDDYLPDSTRVGAKMFHELAVELTHLGHNVTVITPGFEQKHAFRETQLDKVKIWNFRSSPIKDIGKIQRAINETVLSHRAWSAIKHRIKGDTFDGVVYYSPSIFFGGLVSKIKQRCACRSYLILRDFFPQWAIDSGLINAGSMIERYFRYFEKRNYSAANVIGVMSQKNLEVFGKQSPCYSGKSEILRNWASLKPSEEVYDIRKKLSLENHIIFFYGGNIGHAQDMANLMRLAKGMNDYQLAHFLFIGQGDEVELIKQLAEQWQLSNFTFLPSVGQDAFKKILAEIDIGLFSLSKKHTAHNFPGKLLGYMVEAKPILGSINKGNDLKEVINSNSAGYILDNGEDQSLLNSAIKLYEDQEERMELGLNSQKLLENEFSVSSAANLIVKGLRS
ncbi:glycosyltransferase family 4 protein [Pseudoalteromonas aurantia]|uniref:Glycosyl transferase family 1 domain-containing protein n=1 Tax=Pseudoalteromonas aurantia 208 TaxID=1314867 RepID=A0ABR9EE49_9GAMM|nr:glycosyltransferase family 4 protein [Pseudoalteromonas aurantia]MBE0369250.1 hypothetical protein [Pseudoalteromonas aurantia 208]